MAALNAQMQGRSQSLMRRKWKIGMVVGGAAVAFGVFWLWPSGEPTYEGKRLGEWLDEGMMLSQPAGQNPSAERVVKAVNAIGTNAIPFLLRDMERKQDPRWLNRLKGFAAKLRVIDHTHARSWRVNRSVWGFQALGTNGAPALERLLVLHDSDSLATGSAQTAVVALGTVAVPELEKRLHSTNVAVRWRAAATLVRVGPAAEPAIPSLVALLDDTNALAHPTVVLGVVAINGQPERFVPLFRGWLVDSNSLIRAYAAEGLRRFGKSAEVTVPDLLAIANDPDPNVSNAVRRALEQIDPSGLKKLPRRHL